MADISNWTINNVKFSDLGITDASIDVQTQSAGKFSFTIEAAKFDVAGGYDETILKLDQEVVVRNPSGRIFFVGKMRQFPKSANAGAETKKYAALDAWNDLERTTYKQYRCITNGEVLGSSTNLMNNDNAARLDTILDSEVMYGARLGLDRDLEEIKKNPYAHLVSTTETTYATIYYYHVSQPAISTAAVTIPPITLATGVVIPARTIPASSTPAQEYDVQILVMKPGFGEANYEVVPVEIETNIKDCLQFAIDRGSNFKIGTIDLNKQKVPWGMLSAVTIAEYIKTILKWCPGCSTEINYETVPPTLNIKAVTKLAVSEKSLLDLSDLQLDPIYDLVVPGVKITYQKNQMSDGVETLRLYEDSVGLTETIGALNLRCELAPEVLVYRSTTIQTNKIDADDRDWWMDRIPWLPAVKKITDDSYLDVGIPTQRNFPFSGPNPVSEAFVPLGTPGFLPVDPSSLAAAQERLTKQLNDTPYEIIGGGLAQWMFDSGFSGPVPQNVRGFLQAFNRLKTNDFTIRRYFDFRIQYEEGYFQSYKSYKIEVSISACNLKSGRYVQYVPDEYDAGEEIPAGLAQMIFDQSMLLTWNGQAVLEGAECAKDTLGKVFRVPDTHLNGISTMFTPIQKISFSISQGRTTYGFGAPGHLGFSDLVELIRMSRQRKPLRNKKEQEQGEQKISKDDLYQMFPRRDPAPPPTPASFALQVPDKKIKIRVNITPTRACQMGAKWSLDGKTWYSASNDPQRRPSEGDDGFIEVMPEQRTYDSTNRDKFIVQFNVIPGWNTPPPVTVTTLRPGQTYTVGDNSATSAYDYWPSGGDPNDPNGTRPEAKYLALVYKEEDETLLPDSECKEILKNSKLGFWTNGARTQSSDPTKLVHLANGSGGTGSNASPWDLIIDSSGDSTDTWKILPGAINNLLADNYDTSFTIAKTGMFYLVAAVTTDGRDITGITLSLTGTPPVQISPELNDAPGTFQIHLGLVRNGTPLNLWKKSLSARIVETLRVSVSPSSPYGRNYASYYTWSIT